MVADCPPGATGLLALQPFTSSGLITSCRAGNRTGPEARGCAAIQQRLLVRQTSTGGSTLPLALPGGWNGSANGEIHDPPERRHRTA